MRWKDRPSGPKWRKWFAWYPVKIGDTWVWLEVIERSVEFMRDFAIVEHRFTATSEEI